MEKDTDGDTWQAEEQRRNHTNTKKVSLLPLIFLIFYEVSGGPFGIEDSVRAGGPLLAILGFIVFPFIWSIPEALITAELATMLPSDAGYVGWISAAFGPYWGFQQGWWKWLSGVIDNALYPVLFLDYLKTLVPEVSSVRHIKPSRWGGFSRKNVDWNLYLNTLFWNLNYWDSISTLTGEVDNPKKTMPKALFFALLLVVGCYLVPLMSATGALEVMRENWTDGYFSVAAGILGGHWLQLWIAVAAAFSNTGMFEAEMSSDAFMLLGMGEDGMLPKVFAGRSKHGTPLLGILCSASGVLLLSSLSFQEIVAAENYLYCLGMFAEFAAFVTLRIREPDMSRPYSVPLNTTGTVILCFVPSLLLIWVLVVASLKVTLISLGAVLIGFLLWPFLQILKKRKWVEFVSDADEDAGFLAGQHTV